MKLMTGHCNKHSGELIYDYIPGSSPSYSNILMHSVENTIRQHIKIIFTAGEEIGRHI
jgi:hypothetical protein